MINKRFKKVNHFNLLRALVFVMLATEIITFSSIKATEDNSDSKPQATSKESFAQIIRRLIDLPQQVSAGGSRSNGASQPLCIITPTVERKDSILEATVVVKKPTIVTNTPLNEIRIKKANNESRILFQDLASSTNPVTTPIHWPLEPIKPNETYILELRSAYSNASETTRIILKPADAATLNKNKSTQRRYRDKDQSLAERIKTLQESEPRLAIELIAENKNLLTEQNQALIKILLNACERRRQD